MPALRYETIRIKKMTIRRKGGRNGVSSRIVGDVTGRLRDIRALWFAVQNDPNRSVVDVAAEFYFAVGEILEGRSVTTLNLRRIDKERVKQHVEE